MDEWKMSGKPALVILHMQQGIVGKRCNIPGLHEEVHKTGIIPRQQALLRAFRDRKLPVIYVSALHVTSQQNPAGVLPAYVEIFRHMEATQPSPDNLETIPELAPEPDEPVLINWVIGAFNNSGLEQVLTTHCVETLVLAGCATHIVVYATALQAVDRLYSVIITRDACTSSQSHAKAEEVVLDMMGPTIALVTSTEDVIAHL